MSDKSALQVESAARRPFRRVGVSALMPHGLCVIYYYNNHCAIKMKCGW